MPPWALFLLTVAQLLGCDGHGKHPDGLVTVPVAVFSRL